MAELSGRALIESRFGPLGCGSHELDIAGKKYTVPELLVRMDLQFDDCRGIDALVLSPGCYVVRYYDGADQRVVALEFDVKLRYLGETRAHIAEWTGEKEYFSLYSGH